MGLLHNQGQGLLKSGPGRVHSCGMMPQCSKIQLAGLIEKQDRTVVSFSGIDMVSTYQKSGNVAGERWSWACFQETGVQVFGRIL